MYSCYGNGLISTDKLLKCAGTCEVYIRENSPRHIKRQTALNITHADRRRVLLRVCSSYMICYVQPQISSDVDSPLVVNRKRLAALNTVRFFFFFFINAVICCMAKLIQPS